MTCDWPVYIEIEKEGVQQSPSEQSIKIEARYQEAHYPFISGINHEGKSVRQIVEHMLVWFGYWSSELINLKCPVSVDSPFCPLVRDPVDALYNSLATVNSHTIAPNIDTILSQKLKIGSINSRTYTNFSSLSHLRDLHL